MWARRVRLAVLAAAIRADAVNTAGGVDVEVLRVARALPADSAGRSRRGAPGDEAVEEIVRGWAGVVVRSAHSAPRRETQ